MKQSQVGRRSFFRQVVGLVGAAWALPRAGVGAEARLPNPVGYATLTWPESELTHALQVTSSHGFKGVQFLGWVSGNYGGDRRGELQGLLRELKLAPVALSCSRIGLHPGGASLDTEKMRGYADFFQHLGGRYLQVTDGGRPNISYSPADIQQLGRQMNELGKIAADSGLTLGYHPHFGTIGETRAGLGRVLEATDLRTVKLIVDVAHLTLGGSDPAEVIRTYHDRVVFFHFKDVRKEIWELARKDPNLVRRKPCHFCEIGAGAVDFGPILAAIRDVGFQGWVIVELDPCKELAGGPDGAAERNQKAMRKLGFAV
jgi:inosose dehydratase